MCLCVYPNGTGSGYGTHLSVSLLLLFDDHLEWPVSLSPQTGIKVELLVEVEVEVEGQSNDQTTTNQTTTEDTEIELTWKPSPKSSAKNLKKQGKVRGDSFTSNEPPVLLKKRSSSYLPPWCTENEEIETNGTHGSSDLSSERKQDSSKEDERAEGITLIMSEKFALLSLVDCYAREYDSLVFQAALCLV